MKHKYDIWGLVEDEHLSFPFTTCDSEEEAMALVESLNGDLSGTHYWYEKSEL